MLAAYQNLVESHGVKLSAAAWQRLRQSIDLTHWDEPSTPLDLNNCGVMALIEADGADTDLSRGMYLELAISAFTEGANLDHPLCKSHLAYLYSLYGEHTEAMQLAFPALLQDLDTGLGVLDSDSEDKPLDQPIGLVYLTPRIKGISISQRDQWQRLLEGDRLESQALILYSIALCQSQLVRYNAQGVRLLLLQAQLLGLIRDVTVPLGIYGLSIGQQESLVYLYQAYQRNPDNSGVLQALYLYYRNHPSFLETAQKWLNLGRTYYDNDPKNLHWQWAKLKPETPYTYLVFDDDILLTVEARLESIVTRVLLADYDWFEAELEFWRESLKPGMTIIDVGANAGIYAFSAAKRVGESGCVLAIEPFSACLDCLEETRRRNQFDQVKIFAGAASNYNGMIGLSLHPLSEGNQVVSQDKIVNNNDLMENVECFTLDTLIQTHNIVTVDFVKIDVEGHELEVLQGARKLITKFHPVILYENLIDDQAMNSDVPKFLQSLNYELFEYQPWLRKLLPIDLSSSSKKILNIVAIHDQSKEGFL